MYIERQDLEDKIKTYREKAEQARNKADGRAVLAKICAMTSVVSSIILTGEWKLVALPFLGGMAVELYGTYRERNEQRRYENRIKKYQETISASWD